MKSTSHVSFDGMCWPHPHDPGEIEDQLRNGDAESVRLTAASYVSAYRHLIEMPQRARNERIEQLKREIRGYES
ncbi:hypothetical protein [Demequina sp. SO4-18]|uniref:hypothetical protein n=1 Tax=Demequina sp. SO4-18 TaxID=3401026 RepID=UPI003B5BB66B